MAARLRDGVKPQPAVPSESTDGGLYPFDREQVIISKREYIELRSMANSYKTQHFKACQRIQRLQEAYRKAIKAHKAREAELLEQLKQKKAALRGLRQRHFGTRSERASRCRPPDRNTNARQHSARPRGQQPGAPGHGRTVFDDLPKRVQWHGMDRACPDCGKPMTAIAGSKDSEVVEIEVAAHRRVIRRQRYRASCDCGCLPAVTAAPPPAQLIPRGKLGVSVWVEILLSKYRHCQPTHRLCQDWAERGLPVAQGTITDGLKRLQPLFDPLMADMAERLRGASHWHADETQWKVFEPLEGKTGHRWFMWLFLSSEVVYFTADPGRSAEVPGAVLTQQAEGILSVDDYSAYQKYVRLNPKVVRSLCWVHQRREFIVLAIQEPALWPWAMRWLERIARLYRYHTRRQQTKAGTRGFERQDAILRRHVERLRKQAVIEHDDPKQRPEVRRLHRLMLRKWTELTVFLDHPGISLDNNPAEQKLRPTVVGRKNYYGSGSQWSAGLAASMMSLLATLDLWGINPRSWLADYLQACADAGGKVPVDYPAFLPWRLSPEQRARLSQPPALPAPMP